MPETVKYKGLPEKVRKSLFRFLSIVRKKVMRFRKLFPSHVKTWMNFPFYHGVTVRPMPSVWLPVHQDLLKSE